MATSLQPWRAEILASGLAGSGNAPILSGDRARAAALLVGCVIGLGLSWHAFLPDGARDRLAAVITGSSGAPAEFVDATPPWPEHDVPSIAGMKPEAGRPPQSGLPVSSPTAAALPLESVDPPAEPVAPAIQRPLPEEHAVDLPQTSDAEPPEPAMEVTFQLNSSYLPAGATDELGRFLDGLPKEARAELELQATVSDDGVKDADSPSAQRYNRWLAERRLARVEEFLERHGHGRVTVTSGLLEHDSTRRVLLRARPGS